jgi:hypothetical protein
MSNLNRTYYILDVSEINNVPFNNSPNKLETVRKRFDNQQFIVKYDNNFLPSMLSGSTSAFTWQEMTNFLAMPSNVGIWEESA